MAERLAKFSVIVKLLLLLVFSLALTGIESWSSPVYRHRTNSELEQRTRSRCRLTASSTKSHDFRRRGTLQIRLDSSKQSDQLLSSLKENSLTKLAVSPVTEQYTEDASVAKDSAARDSDSLLAEEMQTFWEDEKKEYNRGLAVILFITFLFAANSPLAHAVFSMADIPPPVLLVNAGAAVAALVGLFTFKPILEGASMLETPNNRDWADRDSSQDIQAGFEMGLAKTLGATLNFYGLSMTSATHGAFLVQLTTLFVPVIQGLTGVPITKKMWTAVALAMSGVFLFTQGSDGTGDATLLGDALCVASALFLGLYDLRLNKWGDKVPPVTLITNKIASQAILSSALVLAFGGSEVMNYLQDVVFSGKISTNVLAFAALALGNGLLVNAGASLLQVRGQNAIGPTTCQVVYATQPLVAAVLSYFFLKENVGLFGLAGGVLFMAALYLAGQPDAVSKEEVNAASGEIDPQ